MKKLLASLFLSILLAAQGRAAISFVQSNSGTCGACASKAVAFSSNNAAGDLILVTAGGLWSSGNALTISDTAGNSYTQAKTRVGGAGHAPLTQWYACNSIAGANTVTVANAPSGDSFQILIVNIQEFSGAKTTSCLDQNGTEVACVGGCGLTITTSSITTTDTNELVEAVMVYDNRISTGSDTSSPLATRVSTPGPAYGRLWNSDAIEASTGSYNNVFSFGTGSNADAYTAFIFSFFQAPAVSSRRKLVNLE